MARFAGGVIVHALQRVASGWRLLDAQGRVIDSAETVVLANAGDAMRLLDALDWPIEPVRGQLSMASTEPTGSGPRLPISGAGYLLPATRGQLVFGATSQTGDWDDAVRTSDHLDNLARLAPWWPAARDWSVAELTGRVAWRWVSRDRLPVIGAVPEWPLPPAATAARLEQPRFVPRRPGLFVFTALGSRGITWSALGAQVLASVVSGAPSPLEASLLDAVDPARFVSRWVRQRATR
jgi:tRNA 5-methylaminomethyl-2-thiouridine biosynthesis bifunctional protein